jgi:hypothetical protein
MEEAGVFDRVPPEKHAEIVERQARLMPTFAWLGPTVFLPIMLVPWPGCSSSSTASSTRRRRRSGSRWP